MFYDMYLSLCNKAGKTPSGAALEMGLSKPTVNRWKNGGGATDATIKKVADYFNVPVSDLTGEGQKNSSLSEEKELSETKRRLIEYISNNDLTEEQAQAWLMLIEQAKK